MAPKPKAKKPQTEEKAKGLIGLNKGKKVEGAAYSVGNYKGKTLNLSAKQIAKSGVKGAKAASKATATSISDTKYEKGKGVTKDGKAFTGKVDLGGGNIAVYVGGKRVKAAAKKPAPVGRGGGATTSKGGTGTGTGTGSGKGGGGGKGGGSTTPTGMTLSPRQQAAARRGEAAARRSGRTYANGRPGASAYTASTIRATGMAPSRPASRPSTTASASATKPPKEGQRRTRIVGRTPVVETYRNGRWVPLTGSRGGY